MQLLRLRTFGGITVARGGREAVAAANANPRSLALLALLAVAGKDGLSRDRLVGLLWPESDQGRARHSLTQALYLTRRALSCEDLFDVGPIIRLNGDRLGSDVQDFDAALERGDLAAAAGLYQGPFLDGFYLSGALEFEQWSELLRARLEDKAIAVLEKLGSDADAAGDRKAAVEWWRRVTALRPLDAGAAVKLMMALSSVGDRAGALQHAHLHETLLQRELELGPDPVVRDLAERLRDPLRWTTAKTVVAVRPEPDEPEPEPVFAVATAELAETAVLVEEEPLHVRVSALGEEHAATIWTPRAAARRTSGRPGPPFLLLVLVLSLLGLVWRNQRTPELTLPIRQVVVVAPFRVAGASNSLDYLSEGLVELLSMRLADDIAARSVDAGAVLGAWRTAGLTKAAEVPRDTVVRLAGRLGAERVVIGSVVGTPARAIVSASVVGVASGKVSGEATVEGPADSITSLVDQLAARLLVAEAGEDAKLAERTSGSLRALRAYLDGQAAHRQGNYLTAVQHYVRALDLDSTFALAALRMAVTAGVLNDAELQRTGLARAWKHQQGLSERDRAHLIALQGPQYPAPSSAAQHLAAWEQAAALSPQRPEVWFGLGTHLLHYGGLLGLPDAGTRAQHAVQRALTLDASFAPARLFLIRHATALGAGLPADTTKPDSLASFAPFLRWRIAHESKDTVTLQQIRDSLPALGPANLHALALASMYDGTGLDDGARAIMIQQRRARDMAAGVDLALAEHSMATNRGQPAAALDATRKLERLTPGSHLHLRLRILDALFAEGDSSEAALAARELEVRAQPPGSPGARANACVLAQWRLSRADTAGVKEAVRALNGSDSLHAVTTDLESAVCAALLDATLGVLQQERAGATLQQLDSLVVAGPAVGDLNAYAHLWLARLHARAGDPERALQVIRRRAEGGGWPRYQATSWLEEGLLAEQTGNTSAAHDAFRRYLQLRGAPEESVAPHVEMIRLRLTRKDSLP